MSLLVSRLLPCLQHGKGHSLMYCLRRSRPSWNVLLLGTEAGGGLHTVIHWGPAGDTAVRLLRACLGFNIILLDLVCARGTNTSRLVMKDMPLHGAVKGKPVCAYGGNAGEGARHLQGLLVESRPASTYGSLVDVEGGSIIRRGQSGVWEDTVVGSIYVTLSSRKSLRAGVLLSLAALAILFVAFTWPRELTFALSRDQPTVQVISGSPSPFVSPYAPTPAEMTVLKASTVVYLTNPNYFSFRITDLDVPLYDFERVYIGRAFLTLSPVYLHSRSTSVLPVSALLTMTTHETMKVAQNCWRNDRRTRLYMQGNVTMHALLVRHVVPIVHTVDVDCTLLSGRA